MLLKLKVLQVKYREKQLQNLQKLSKNRRKIYQISQVGMNKRLLLKLHTILRKLSMKKSLPSKLKFNSRRLLMAKQQLLTSSPTLQLMRVTTSGFKIRMHMVQRSFRNQYLPQLMQLKISLLLHVLKVLVVDMPTGTFHSIPPKEMQLQVNQEIQLSDNCVAVLQAKSSTLVTSSTDSNVMNMHLNWLLHPLSSSLLYSFHTDFNNRLKDSD